MRAFNEGKKYISIREWTGRPYNSEQRIIKEVHQVSLQKITIVRIDEHQDPKCWVDGKPVPIDQVAANDGLDKDDFISFMYNECGLQEACDKTDIVDYIIHNQDGI